MQSEKTDEEIVSELQKGNKDFFSVIIDRYEAKMVRYAKRYFKDEDDVKDMVQDVFVKSYINIQSFNNNLKFSPWIYRIAHNTFVNKIAWKSIRNLVSIDSDDFLPHTLPADENVERHSINREQKEIFEKYLDKLDEKYKTPIILFFYEDMSYEEISDVLKIPVSTLGVRIKRGKEKLKNIIEEKQKTERSENK